MNKHTGSMWNENMVELSSIAEEKIKNEYGIDLATLLELLPMNEAFMLINSFIEIRTDYFDQFRNYLCQIHFSNEEKIISAVTDSELISSKKNSNSNSLVSEEEIQLIFRALEKNFSLYDRLYKDKIFRLQTTLDNKSTLLNISNAKLLHLLGFSVIDWQRNCRKDILSVLPEFRELLSENYVSMCKKNDVKLYKAIEIILDKEDLIINALKDSDVLDRAFSLQKIKVKNFAFERLGLIESPAGIVFYEKSRDLYGERSKLKSDIYLLRDFMGDFDLHWIFNGYAHQNVVEKNNKKLFVKDAETLLIEKDASSKFNNQIVAISSAVGSMRKSDFDFNVLPYVVDESEAAERVSIDIEFNEEKVKKMAEKIKQSFNQADLTNIEEVITHGPNGPEPPHTRSR